MFDKPRSFMRRVVKRANGTDPTDSPIRYRFFNESNDMADVEAYGSQAGVTYQPIAVQPGVGPHSARESYMQFPPVPDPMHIMVIIHLNSEPLGPFYLMHYEVISIVETTLNVNPVTQELSVQIAGWDALEDPIPIVSYP